MSSRGIELELPDLPEVPISLGPVPGAPPSPRPSTGERLWEALMAWLPLLLVGLLALGTWWLVKHAPPIAGVSTALPPRTAPDYTMSRFTLQRFAPDGQLRLQIEGETLRHLPQSAQVEVDDARILAWATDGRTTQATAKQVSATDDGSTVELRGQVEVRTGGEKGLPAEMSSESLRLLPSEQKISGDRPVEVRVGRHRLTAGGIEADQLTGSITLQAPVRGSFQP